MFEALCQLHHFPGGPEDSFVTLVLPELDVEFTIWESALDEPGFPFWFQFAVHGSNANCTNGGSLVAEGSQCCPAGQRRQRQRQETRGGWEPRRGRPPQPAPYVTAPSAKNEDEWLLDQYHIRFGVVNSGFAFFWRRWAGLETRRRRGRPPHKATASSGLLCRTGR